MSLDAYAIHGDMKQCPKCKRWSDPLARHTCLPMQVVDLPAPTPEAADTAPAEMREWCFEGYQEHDKDFAAKWKAALDASGSKDRVETAEALARASYLAGWEANERPAPASPGEAAAPRPMAWTREKPKADGWYWYRVPGQAKQSIDLIQMFTGSACWHSAERHAWVPITWDLEWSGPIPEPQDERSESVSPSGEPSKSLSQSAPGEAAALREAVDDETMRHIEHAFCAGFVAGYSNADDSYPGPDEDIALAKYKAALVGSGAVRGEKEGEGAGEPSKGEP